MSYDPQQLAFEIHSAFNTVQEFIPDLIDQIDARFLEATTTFDKWLPMKKGERSRCTMRDRVLYGPNYEALEDTLKVCDVSLDMVSNAEALDVDHFFPKSTMFSTIEAIARQEDLLGNIKTKLVEIIKLDIKTQSEQSNAVRPIREMAIGTGAQSIVDKLIPGDTAGGFNINVLKRIFCNHPINLSAMSNVANREKNDKEPIKFTIALMLEKMQKQMRADGYTHISAIVRIDAAKLGITEDITIMDKKDLERVSGVLSKAMLDKFNMLCNRSGIMILPYYKEGDIENFMLDFFKQTNVVQQANKLAEKLTKNINITLPVAIFLAQQARIAELLT